MGLELRGGGEMIERFEAGKSYLWIGPKGRIGDWNIEGLMDFLLDGNPHKCSIASDDGSRAGFEGHESPYNDHTWAFYSRLGYFEEVPVV
jgi:hypothetical protein